MLVLLIFIFASFQYPTMKNNIQQRVRCGLEFTGSLHTVPGQLKALISTICNHNLGPPYHWQLHKSIVDIVIVWYSTVRETQLRSRNISGLVFRTTEGSCLHEHMEQLMSSVTAHRKEITVQKCVHIYCLLDCHSLQNLCQKDSGILFRFLEYQEIIGKVFINFTVHQNKETSIRRVVCFWS